MRFLNTPYPASMNDGNHVFVFGSNLAGRHGAGAALEAKRNWGAINGIGNGSQGNAYGIPTKDHKLRTLLLSIIQSYVTHFKVYAGTREDVDFLITPIGTGLAGYSHEQIAPMFKDAPNNCILPEEWKPVLFSSCRNQNQD